MPTYGVLGETSYLPFSGRENVQGGDMSGGNVRFPVEMGGITPIQNMYYRLCGVDCKSAEFTGNKFTHSLTYSAVYISTEVGTDADRDD